MVATIIFPQVLISTMAILLGILTVFYLETQGLPAAEVFFMFKELMTM